MKCAICKDTGCRVEPGEEIQTYCSCPIGEAFGAAWDQRVGGEEAMVEKVEAMRAFLAAPASPATPAPSEEAGRQGGGYTQSPLGGEGDGAGDGHGAHRVNAGGPSPGTPTAEGTSTTAAARAAPSEEVPAAKQLTADLPAPEILNASWPGGDWRVEYDAERDRYRILAGSWGCIAEVRPTLVAFWIVEAQNAARRLVSVEKLPGVTVTHYPVRPGAPSSEAGTRGACGNCGCDHSEHHPLAGGCTRCGCERFGARPRREGEET